MIPELSWESAAGKAIVLVPKSINANAALKDPTAKVAVVIFLHGHTENTGRPFAGWRALELKLKKG